MATKRKLRANFLFLIIWEQPLPCLYFDFMIYSNRTATNLSQYIAKLQINQQRFLALTTTARPVTSHTATARTATAHTNDKHTNDKINTFFVGDGFIRPEVASFCVNGCCLPRIVERTYLGADKSAPYKYGKRTNNKRTHGFCRGRIYPSRGCLALR